MKKVLGYIVAALLLVMPVVTFAAEKIDLANYKTMNLKETLDKEGIKMTATDYAETDDQINIYMFRGNGCGYCRAFLTYLESITKEYGKYFKLVSFEVWQDADNAELLDAIGSFLGQEASGVPYIIIGDQVFPGYAESYNTGIEEAIKKLYETEKSKRYDVFEEYNKKLVADERAARSQAAKPIIWNFIFIAIATIVVVCKLNADKKEVLAAVKAQAKKEPKEPKEVKTTSRKRK